jgi:hypothetical protein
VSSTATGAIVGLLIYIAGQLTYIGVLLWKIASKKDKLDA